MKAPICTRELATNIILEVRRREGQDVTAPIGSELLDNIEHRIHTHIQELTDWAIAVSERMAQIAQNDPKADQIMKMSNHELAS